jgi:hypothetical protein
MDEETELEVPDEDTPIAGVTGISEEPEKE